MRQVLLVLICVHFIYWVRAQENLNIHTMYDGGAKHFYHLIAPNFQYPDKSVVGTAIVSWKIENGQMKDMVFINSLGPAFDEEISRVLKLTSENWLVKDTSIQFFLPIKFLTAKTNSSNPHEYYCDPFPDYFMTELITVGSPASGAVLSDDILIDKINSAVINEKYKKALRPLNEVLNRNPLNQKLRETRIHCYQRLGRHAKACSDIAFIETYLNHKPRYNCVPQ